MKDSSLSGAPQNQTARIGPIIRIFLDDFSRLQALYDFADTNDSVGLRLHFTARMLGEDTPLQGPRDDLIVH
jgi:hypothetical protein